MSVILEALKKVEQKGKHGGMPKLLSYPGEAGARDRKRPLWPYILSAALLLNAGAIFWWIGSRSGPPHPDVQVPVVRQAPHPAVDSQPSPAPTAPRAEQAGQSRQGPVKEPPEERGAARTAPAARTRPAPPAVASVQQQPQTEKKPAPSGRVLSQNELPAQVRSSLPAFKVSGHAYSSDPALRVTRINDQILQEGHSLSPGLRVEEIIPDGVVLSYQGYRFEVGISGN